MVSVSENQIRALDSFTTDDLYRAIGTADLGAFETGPKNPLERGRLIFQQMLPQLKAHLCGNAVFAKVLTERSFRTPVDLAVLICDALLQIEVFKGVPIGAVSLIIVRELLDTLCLPDSS